MSEEIKPVEYRKEEWARGPWDNEPDRVDFVNRGFACFIQRNHMGVWCGYVGVPATHSAFGKSYQDTDVDVHGGLTYSDRCQGHICHVPKAGMPADVWWFGFDCGHSDDLSPRFSHLLGWGTYRDMNYAVQETKDLARQLQRMG